MNIAFLQKKFLPPANEVWGKVMFSQVFVCPREGGWLPRIRSYMTRGHLPPPGGSASEGVCIRGGGWIDPPRDTWDTTGYGQQAGGTHRTEMHSCCPCQINHMFKIRLRTCV